jgi:type III restriction enzyme
MGMLKKSDNTVSRRQEIGRGLRLSVDQHGERMDNPVTVHDINELTVVTDESYTDFVTGLQKEIIRVAVGAATQGQRRSSSSARPSRRFHGESVIEEAVAQALYKYLVKNDYIDDDTISDAGVQGRQAPTEPFAVPLPRRSSR